MFYYKALEMLKAIILSQDTLATARFAENSFIRKRGMQFPDALSFLLDMRKSTLQTRLNLYFRNVKGGTPISQQAFSKLRMNFDHSPFETMVRELVKKEYSGQYELPLWNGYHVFAVDGSFLQLPRVNALREEFGVRGRGRTCPCAGLSVLYDVLHGWVLDPIISRADRNERVECARHIDMLCTQLPHIVQNSILLLDRGYPSLDLLEKLQSSGLKFLARCASQSISEINAAPMGDSSAVLRNGVPVRIFKFRLPAGDVETLVTNLFEVQETLLPELYAMRWGIESAYFLLKRELCVEKFSGKTPNSIRQDFWASIVLLNMARIFQKEADAAVQKRQNDCAGKHVNRARTSALIVTLRDRFIFATLSGNSHLAACELEALFDDLSRVLSPIRPGRTFPRNFKAASPAKHNLKDLL